MGDIGGKTMIYELVITGKNDSKKVGDFESFSSIINQLNEMIDNNDMDFIKLEIFKFDARSKSMESLIDDFVCNINTSYKNLLTIANRLRDNLMNTYNLRIDIIERDLRFDLFVLRKNDKPPFSIIITTEGIGIYKYNKVETELWTWNKINKDYEALFCSIANMITKDIEEFEERGEQ